MNKIKFDRFLSETRFMEDINFSDPFKIMVDVPTGGGKTYYIISYLKEHNIPFVFLVDTLLLMKQISKDFNIPYYCADNRESFKSKQLVTVYNHINKFYDNRVVVIDEAHSMVSDYDYKRGVIEDLLAFGDIADKVLMLSGTPIISRDEFYEGVQYMKFTKKYPKRYTIKNIVANDGDAILHNAISLAKDIKAQGKIPVFSMLDTKSRLNDLCGMLKTNGFREIALINSVVKDGELDLDSTHYEELVNNANIKADCMITTYVQGYNINNKNCSLIILPGTNRHSYISIAQMVARFRKIDNLDIYMITYERDKEVKCWYNFNRMTTVLNENLYKKATTIIDTYRRLSKTDRAIRKLLELNEKNSYLVNNDLKINEQMLSNRLLKDISVLMYSNTHTANVILNRYNINVINTINKIGDINMNKEELKAIDYQIAVQTYFAELAVGRIDHSKMGMKVNECYEELVKFRLTNAEIKRILMKVFGNKKEYNRVILGYQFRLSELNDIKRMRKDIFLNFKVGNWYSSQEIFDKVSNIIVENGGNCNSKNRASEIFNFLFDTEVLIKKVNGVSARGFIVKFRK